MNSYRPTILLSLLLLISMTSLSIGADESKKNSDDASDQASKALAQSEPKETPKPLTYYVVPYPGATLTRVDKVEGDVIAQWQALSNDDIDNITKFYANKSRFAKGWKIIAARPRIIMLAKGKLELFILIELENDKPKIIYKLQRFKC